MSRFNFISDENLRTSLERDYEELQNCLSAKAWKAAHVLAGSIIEAVLIDYLILINYSKSSPLQMGLDQALRACLEENVISQRTVDLSNVIKSYRNLIHPGRAMRLGECVDAESAKVADALVRIVVQDISGRKSLSYGYTAEQIVKKLENDSSATAILINLLIELNERERERLLLDVLQDKYFEILKHDYEEMDQLTLDALEVCFQITFDLVDDKVRIKVLDKFARVVKEESQYFITQYENVFFRATQLKYLTSESNKTIVKRHLFSRLKAEQSSYMLRILEGIAEHVKKQEIHYFIDPCIRLYLNKEPERTVTLKFITSEFFRANEQIQTRIIERLEQWVNFLYDKGSTQRGDLIKQIKSDLTFSSLESELPF